MFYLADYGLGSNMFTWNSVLDNYITRRDFKNVKDWYMENCNFPTVDDIPFPPRDDGPDLFQAMDFFIEKMEGEKTKKFYSLFPTAEAPWPILLHHNMEIPIEECEWVWTRWVTNEKPLTYSLYSKKVMTDPEIYCMPSKWSPFSLMAINEVGGICGQHSTLQKSVNICLGNPANLITQPGHLALFVIHYDPLTTDDIMRGPWRFQGHQYIGDSNYNAESSGFSPSDQHTLTLAGEPYKRVVSHDFEKGVVYTMNQGYDAFIEGRIALNIFNRVDDDKKQDMLPFMVDILEKTPYHLHMLYTIADFLTGKHWTINKGNFRYPTFCKTFDGLDSLRDRLLVLADSTFYDNRHMLHAYYDVITRIVFPSSCCKTKPEYKASLTEIYTKMDSWKEKYADWIRMHYINCEAVEGALDDEVTQVNIVFCLLSLNKVPYSALWRILINI